MDVAVRIAVYGLIVRMYGRRAVLERHLMLAADAMLQRPREHALDRQCYRDDPNQQETSEFVHLGRYRTLEQRSCLGSRNHSTCLFDHKLTAAMMNLAPIARSTSRT